MRSRPFPSRLSPQSRRSLQAALALGVLAVVSLAVAAVLIAGGRSSSKIPPLPRLGVAKVVFDGDFGDPFVLTTRVGSGPVAYQLFGTDDWPSRVPTARSTDLMSWQSGPDALPVLPAWADPDPGNTGTWAPAALSTGSGYLLYISVLDAASRHHCIAVTSAPDPAGPYHDAIGRPLVCQPKLGGSIDPSVTHDAKGGLHLVWKSDAGCCVDPAALWEEDLTSNGLQLTGQSHRLLQAGRPWQAGIIENPALLPATGGGWWLFYSGNRFDSAGYATGLAYCPNIAGPCRETSDRPFLSGTADQFSPGGLDFFRDAGGRLWASFATWSRPARNGRFYCCRPLNIAPVLRS